MKPTRPEEFDPIPGRGERSGFGVLLAIAAVLLMAWLWYATANAADANITWTNATQRVDGTAIAAGELVETQIEYAKCVAGNQFPPTIDGTKAVPFPGTATAIPLSSYGTWCFRARHKDSGGQFSDYAGPVWKQYVAPPNPPTLLTVAGIVWEMKVHPLDGPYLARVVGSVEAGKPCYGLAPQIGHDLFSVDRKDVSLSSGVKPRGMLVAQCVVSAS